MVEYRRYSEKVRELERREGCYGKENTNAGEQGCRHPINSYILRFLTLSG
jgi:hypothetical protein